MSLTRAILIPLLPALLAGSALAYAAAPAGPSPSPSGEVARGQAIAFDRSLGNCLACHTMKGSDVPSDVGPELSNIKQRFPNRSDLYTIIYDEEQRNPQTVMPAFGKNLILSKRQINAVIDFLNTL